MFQSRYILCKVFIKVLGNDDYIKMCWYCSYKYPLPIYYYLHGVR